MARSSRAEKLDWITAVVLEHDEGAGCRIWPWAKSGKGYGQIQWNGQVRYVGHVILDLTGRGWPDDKQQLHSCDTPQCAAPWHLSWGTNAENRQESVERGRTSRGIDRPRAKLDDDKVRAIRSSTEPLTVLADRYGVHFTVAYRAKVGQTWRHVT